MRSSGDADIVRDLIAQGCAPEHAERLVDFVPIAFGRAVLEHLGVRPSADAVAVVRGEERPFRLTEDPVFADAADLARGAYADGTMAPEVFQSCALRSAELNAVNQALTAGAKAGDLQLSPPRFSW
jgi:hypothetical protein